MFIIRRPTKHTCPDANGKWDYSDKVTLKVPNFGNRLLHVMECRPGYIMRIAVMNNGARWEVGFDQLQDLISLRAALNQVLTGDGTKENPYRATFGTNGEPIVV